MLLNAELYQVHPPSNLAMGTRMLRHTLDVAKKGIMLILWWLLKQNAHFFESWSAYD